MTKNNSTVETHDKTRVLQRMKSGENYDYLINILRAPIYQAAVVSDTSSGTLTVERTAIHFSAYLWFLRLPSFSFFGTHVFVVIAVDKSVVCATISSLHCPKAGYIALVILQDEHIIDKVSVPRPLVHPG